MQKDDNSVFVAADSPVSVLTCAQTAAGGDKRLLGT